MPGVHRCLGGGRRGTRAWRRRRGQSRWMTGSGSGAIRSWRRRRSGSRGEQSGAWHPALGNTARRPVPGAHSSAEFRRVLCGRWYVRRLREERHTQHLRRRERARSGAPPLPAAPRAPPASLLHPAPHDALYIELTDRLPVAAFGGPLPDLPPKSVLRAPRTPRTLCTCVFI